MRRVVYLELKIEILQAIADGASKQSRCNTEVEYFLVDGPELYPKIRIAGSDRSRSGQREERLSR